MRDSVNNLQRKRSFSVSFLHIHKTKRTRQCVSIPNTGKRDLCSKHEQEKRAKWGGLSLGRSKIYGYCIFYGPNQLSWSSRKQRTVSRSSAEAEYRALAATTAEIPWLLLLLRDTNQVLQTPPNIRCDNISSTYLASHGASSIIMKFSAGVHDLPKAFSPMANLYQMVESLPS